MTSSKARIALAVILMVLVASCVRCYHGASISLEAEKTLHAFVLVLDVVAKSMDGNAGRWPTNWDDLARISLDERTSVFRWPQDIPDIRKRIRIDFRITTAQVIANGESHFDAIEQIGPHYDPYRPAVREFLG